jgi:holo-[acyl-carrier protein] synthase
VSTFGIGTDLVEIDRVERALARYPRLAGRIFTESELAEAGDRARPGRYLAGRFAVKEAVVKALCLGPGTALRSIEVLGSTPPEVLLHGDVAEAARTAGATVRASITHEREMAGAVALAEV